MKNIKNWKTTSIGLVILLGLGYKAFTEGFGIEEALAGFVALGFLYSKDFDKSHTQ
jgi:hypothetical protein